MVWVVHGTDLHWVALSKQLNIMKNYESITYDIVEQNQLTYKYTLCRAIRRHRYSCIKKVRAGNNKLTSDEVLIKFYRHVCCGYMQVASLLSVQQPSKRRLRFLPTQLVHLTVVQLTHIHLLTITEPELHSIAKIKTRQLFPTNGRGTLNLCSVCRDF